MNPSLEDRRIAVTGAAGFIGSRVVAELACCGADVVALDNDPGWRAPLQDLARYRRVQFSPTDRRWPYRPADLAVLDGVDSVVHCGYAEPSPAATSEMSQELSANAMATLTMIEGLAPTVSRFVFASTALVYGRRWTVPLCETMPAAPDSPYAIAKLAVEHGLDSWARDHDRVAISLRLSTVYGPQETVPRAIPNFVRSLLRGEAPVVGVAADTRDYVHVDDVGRAIAASLVAPIHGHHVLNVGTGVATTTGELARMVAAECGVPIMPIEGVASRDPVRLVNDVTRIDALTGFRASIGLRDGLGTEVAWFRDRPELWAR